MEDSRPVLSLEPERPLLYPGPKEARSNNQLKQELFQEPPRRPALAIAEKESSLDFSLDKCGMTSGDSGDPEWLGYWATGCCTRSKSAEL